MKNRRTRDKSTGAAARAVAGTPASTSVPAEQTAGRRRTPAQQTAGRRQPSEEARERRYGWYVAAAAVAFAAVLGFLSLQLYRNFGGGRFDLGNMVQAVWSAAHGHFLQVTTADGHQMSRLGAHVDPIIAVFALPWLVWPSPEMLLVLQAAIVAVSAWPAYRIGLRLLHDARAAALLAGAFLLYPPVEFAVLNEFHPVTLAIPLLLFGFLYLEESRWVRAAVFLALAAICKEEIPLVIAVMGAYFAVRQRSWKPLVVTAVAGAYFLVAILVILPHFSPGGSPFIGRYAEHGSTAGEVVKNLVLHPGSALADLFAWADIRYLLQLLWPFAFTSLLSPLTALIAAPEYVLNGLSSQVWQRSIAFHYVAGEVPFVFAAAVLGVARAHRRLERRAAAGARARRRERPAAALSLESLALAVLLASLAANYFMGPLPFSLPGAKYGGRRYAVSAHARALSGAVKMIPAGAGVAAENDAGSHLSARRTIYVFPYVDAAEWVVVDERKPFWYDQSGSAMVQVGSQRMTATAAHAAALGDLLKQVVGGGYQSVYAVDGVYVFKRAQ